MSCPRCGSTRIWDDNLWWGCDDCGYAVGPDGPTAFFMKRIDGLPDNVNDVKRDRPEHFIRLMRIDDGLHLPDLQEGESDGDLDG